MNRNRITTALAAVAVAGTLATGGAAALAAPAGAATYTMQACVLGSRTFTGTCPVISVTPITSYFMGYQVTGRQFTPGGSVTVTSTYTNHYYKTPTTTIITVKADATGSIALPVSACDSGTVTAKDATTGWVSNAATFTYWSCLG